MLDDNNNKSSQSTTVKLSIQTKNIHSKRKNNKFLLSPGALNRSESKIFHSLMYQDNNNTTTPI